MRNLRNIYRVVAIALLLVGSAQLTHAREWSVSTNALSWLNMGTINAEGACSINDNWSINTGFAVNPWQMNTPTYVNLRNRQYGGFVGARYWPWHVFSEWWVGAKVQYKNFEQVGLLTSDMKKGDAVGAGVSAGYSLMISDSFNIDFGVGVWGGHIFNFNDADRSGNFIFLDNISVSIAYIF